MSHTLASGGSPNPFLLTIVNYTSGGETILQSELGTPPVKSAMFGTVSASQNSLAVPLFPILDGGKVKLFRMVSGVPTEIPTTTALNAVIMTLVFVG